MVSLAWSPPGLALHQRSALAVLTANRLLSLWAPHSDTRDPNSWKRVLIINNVLGGLSNKSMGRTRVRCMAWCPSSIHASTNGDTNLSAGTDAFILAIGQDGDPGVRILKTTSPYSKTTDMRWDAIDIASFNPKKPTPTPAFTSLLDIELHRGAHVDYVGFGPLRIENTSLRIIVSSRIAGHYAHALISFEKTALALKSVEVLRTVDAVPTTDYNLYPHPATWLENKVGFPR